MGTDDYCEISEFHSISKAMKYCFFLIKSRHPKMFSFKMKIALSNFNAFLR